MNKHIEALLFYIMTEKISLKNFYQKRNQVLIWHEKGGLGDVLMQRMLIQDFKELCPESELIFACLPEYFEAIQDHPHINQIIDSRKINIKNYCFFYNTCVSITDRYENNNSPCPEHRSDIWAKYCGFKLKNHDMCFNIPQENIQLKREKLQSFKKEKPIILLAPVSKMATKTLLPFQIRAIVDATKDYNVIGIHNKEIPELKKLGVPVIHDCSIKDWIEYIAASDYIISVDTAAFHAAGGLKKPLLGIFTFADGKAYGKYFDFILVQKHRDSGDWECGPCFKFASCEKSKKTLKPCLTELSEDEICIGIKKMLIKWTI